MNNTDCSVCTISVNVNLCVNIFTSQLNVFRLPHSSFFFCKFLVYIPVIVDLDYFVILIHKTKTGKIGLKCNYLTFQR